MITKFIIKYNLQISPVKDWKKIKTAQNYVKYTVTLKIVKSITNFEQNCIFTFSIHILLCVEWNNELRVTISSNKPLQSFYDTSFLLLTLAKQ